MKKKGIIFGLALTMSFSAAQFAQADEWKRDVSLGFTLTDGNTEKEQLSVKGVIQKTSDLDDFLASIDIFRSSTNGDTDAQNWTALGRYAYNFGDDLMWFSSYGLTVDHDKFADIDWRATPKAGLGRWFSKDSDGNDWNAYLEGSLGYEVTEFYDAEDTEETVFILHAWGEKNIFDNAKIVQDLTIIPSLEEDGVRIKSETALTNPLSENLDLSIRYIVDYDSEPPAGVEETDTQLITGIKYSF